KAERDAVRSRLVVLRDELASMPDPDAIHHEAEVLRVMLAQEHTGKDWRNESFDDLRRFLHFLFGDNPKREGLGIFVRKHEGKWTAEVRARLQLRSPELVVGEDGYARLFSGDPGGELVEGEPVRRQVDLLGITT